MIKAAPTMMTNAREAARAATAALTAKQQSADQSASAHREDARGQRLIADRLAGGVDVLRRPFLDFTGKAIDDIFRILKHFADPCLRIFLRFGHAALCVGLSTVERIVHIGLC